MRWAFVISTTLIAIQFAKGATIPETDHGVDSTDELQRSKRSRQGQTQAQYLNFGSPTTDGKADAEITRFGSRATVSGSNGMGQAQSQSSGGDCGDCFGAFEGGRDDHPDPLRSISSSNNGYPQIQTSSTGGYRPANGNDRLTTDIYGNVPTHDGYPSGPQHNGNGISPSQRPIGAPDNLSTDNSRVPSTYPTTPGSNVPFGGGNGYPGGGDHQANIQRPTNGNQINGGGTDAYGRPTHPSVTDGRPNTLRPSTNGYGDGSYLRPIPPSTGRPGGQNIYDDASTSVSPGRGSHPARDQNGNIRLPGSDSILNRPSAQGTIHGQTDNRPTSRPRQTGNEGEYNRPTQPGNSRPNSQIDGRHPSSSYGPSTRTTENPDLGGGRPSGPYDSSSTLDGSRLKQPNRPSHGGGGGDGSLQIGGRQPADGFGPSRGRPTEGSNNNIGGGGGGGGNGSQQKQPSRSSLQPYQGSNGLTPIPSRGSDSSDVYNGIRNAFKLPPGLCLVRCDTLRADQQSLTPQQAHDAFVSSGIVTPAQPNQLSQYPVGSQTHDLPSGSQLGVLQAGDGGQVSTGGDQSIVSQRPSGVLPGQQGEADGSYYYPTPSGAGGQQPGQGGFVPGGQAQSPNAGGFPQGHVPQGPSQGYVPQGSQSNAGSYTPHGGQGQGGIPQGYAPHGPAHSFVPQGSQTPETGEFSPGYAPQQGQGIPSNGGFAPSGPSQGYTPQGGQRPTGGYIPQGGQGQQPILGGFPQGYTPQGGQSQLPTSGGYTPQEGQSQIPTSGGYTPQGHTSTAGGSLQGYSPQGGQAPTSGSYLSPGGQGQAPITGGSPQGYAPQGGQSQTPVSGGFVSPGGQGQAPITGGFSQGYTPQGGQTPTPGGYAPQGSQGQAPITGGSSQGYAPQGGQSQTPVSGGFVSPGGQGQTSAAGGFSQGYAPQGGQTPTSGGYVPQGGQGQAPIAGGLPQGYGPLGGQGQVPTSGGYRPQGGQGQQPISGGFPQGYTPQGGQGQLPTSGGYTPQGGQSRIPTPGGYTPQGGQSQPLTSGGYTPQGGQGQTSATGGFPPGYVPQGPSQIYIPQGGPIHSAGPGGVPQGPPQAYIPQGTGPSAGGADGSYYYPTPSGNGGQQTGQGGFISQGGVVQSPNAGGLPPGYVPQGPAQVYVPQGGQIQTGGPGGYIPPAAPYVPQNGGGGFYTPQGYDQGGHGPQYIPGQTGPQPLWTGGQGYPSQVDAGASQGGGVSSSGGSSESGGVESSGSTGDGNDDANSQAEASIKNGEVVASAQGTKDGGTAQTQVQGTYSGTGSFSASAQTADKDRSAQAQVSGTKDGALSSAQGKGGKGKSQAQVEVDEKTGGTSASSQGGGSKHLSQSSVVANEKGGLADAQGSGPGQTSSQAQIGFRPESENNNSQASTIFNGGGQASAQSGAQSGQSQSQIQGSFNRYGISYHGAAQAGSGTKEQVASYREKNRKLFDAIGQYSRSNRNIDVTVAPDIANINDIGSSRRVGDSVPSSTNLLTTETENGEYPDDDDYEADEGDDVYTDAEEENDTNITTRRSSDRVEVELPTRIELSTTTQKSEDGVPTTASKSQQTVTVRPTAVRSEIIPDGFHGKIEQKKRQSKHSRSSLFDKKAMKPDTYVTVTKSVTGSMDGNKPDQKDEKKFSSTYYTKSSTCGYFTFSCNVVYGSNGRSKICRPKAPINGKC